MGKSKLKANANCNQVILDHFWNICEQSEEKRCRSIQVIVQTLAHQAKVNANQNDIAYCLQRLISGLLSTREFARHGFCVLLTQILVHFPEQTPLADVLSLAVKEYGENFAKASSESAISWALVIGCILKSGRLSNNDPVVAKIFDYLFQLGLKKKYVEIIVCNLLPVYFDVFEGDSKQFEKIVLNTIKENEIEYAKSIFYSYSVLLALQKYPSVSKNYFTDYLSSHIYKKKSNDYTKIFSLLKETTKYHPNIHPINKLVIQTMHKIDSGSFANFCSSLIENIFKVNLEKTSMGFEIVRILMELINSEQVSLVLSANFMRIFIQTLSYKNHPLHNSATELGQYFINLSLEKQSDSEFQLALAKCFVNKPGSINFDELSKSKILASIMRNFTNDSIQPWVVMLKDMMLSEDNIPASDFCRIRCLQQISHLLKSYTRNDQFLWSMSKFLFTYAYFDVSSSKNVVIDDQNTALGKFNCPLSEKLQKQFPDSFKATFAHLCHIATNEVNLQQDKLAKHIEVLSTMVDFIVTLLNKKNVELLSSDADVDNVKQVIIDMREKIEQLSALKNQSIETSIFKLLYLYFIVELFENYDEISTILADFNECANRSLLVNKKSKKTKESRNNEPLWADVLTDLLLSLLTTKSKYTKNIIMSTFKHISPFVTQIGLQSLTDAILNKDAFHGDDSDSEEDADEEMAEPDDEQNLENGNCDQEDEEDDEEEEDDDIMDDDENEVDEQFKLDVIKALGSAAVGEEESDDMSDSEMFKIDDSLAEVFRKKFGEKKRQNERQNLIQTFKSRVLELIQILVECKEMPLAMTLDLLSSILPVTKSSYALKNMAPLTNKCIQIFGSISKKRFLEQEAIEETVLLKVLNSLIDFQSKCSHAELQKSLVALTSWLAALTKSHSLNLQQFQQVIERSLKNFFDRPNVALKSSLFIRLIPQLCDAEQESLFKSDFYEILIDYCFNSDIRSFKRCSAVEILCSLLNSCRPSKDQAQCTKLSTRTISLLIDEVGNLSTAKRDQQQGATSSQTKLQYVNLLAKLILTCHAFESNNAKIRALLQQLNLKLATSSKEFRKKIDKTFARKIKNLQIEN